MILKVINRRMQQWFCKCFSGSRCFTQGNGNFAATLLSVFELCVCKKSWLSSLLAITKLLQNDTQTCMQRHKKMEASLDKPALPRLLCKIFFWARQRVQPRGWGYFPTRQSVNLSKRPELAMEVLCPGFEKQEQDRDKKVQLHPSCE